MVKKVMGVACAALLAATGAFAEWLVLRDGSKIRTRGEAVVVDGEVGYFDLNGQIRRFPAIDLDINATKLTNIAAKRKRGAEEDHFVIDDDQVGHIDPDMAAAIREFRDAKNDYERARAYDHFLESARKVGGEIGKDLKCQDRYPDDWGAQALCRVGKAPPPGVVGKNVGRSGRAVQQLEEASRTLRCRQLYPNNDFNYQVCIRARQ